MKHHFDFVKEFFPQYITEKTIDFYNENVEKFTNESQIKQGRVFESIKENYDNFKSRLH